MKSILEKNLRDVVFTAIGYAPQIPQDLPDGTRRAARALIVYDRESPLANLLTDAYAAVLPDAALLDFSSTTPDAVRAAMDAMSPGDLVVMVQSTSFRLNEFRFRIELFKRGLAVIEHPHVARIVGEEVRTYVDALAYDADYYRTVGPKIKARIDAAKRIVVACDGAELVYETAFETAKLNIGDYSGMTNRGGQFPIGEVFTEPADLSGVNGTVKLFAFGGADFRVTIPEEPVLVVIKEGKIVDAPNAPATFTSILDQIKTEEELWVRELGFGMNRALTRHRFLCDVGSYERMCGIHLSLGAKHTIYAKPGFPKRTSRFHVDVFADVKTVTIDGVVVFKDGAYCV